MKYTITFRRVPSRLDVHDKLAKAALLTMESEVAASEYGAMSAEDKSKYQELYGLHDRLIKEEIGTALATV